MRLVKRGLTERDPNLVIRWGTSNKSDSKIGHSSVLMRTIIVNPKLDTEDITENAQDYALYTQICHVNLGFNGNKSDDADRYEKVLDRYPARNEQRGFSEILK